MIIKKKIKQLNQPLNFSFFNKKENTNRNNEKINNEYFPEKLKHMRTNCLYYTSGRVLIFIHEIRHNPDY